MYSIDDLRKKTSVRTSAKTPEPVVYMDGLSRLCMEGNYGSINKDTPDGWWIEQNPPVIIGGEKIRFQFTKSRPQVLFRLPNTDPRRQPFLDGLRNYLNYLLHDITGGKRLRKRSRSCKKGKSKRCNKKRRATRRK